MTGNRAITPKVVTFDALQGNHLLLTGWTAKMTVAYQTARQTFQSRADFPLFLVQNKEGMQFLPLEQAGGHIANCWHHVDVGDFAIDVDLTIRRATADEKGSIGGVADRIRTERDTLPPSGEVQ